MIHWRRWLFKHDCKESSASIIKIVIEICRYNKSLRRFSSLHHSTLYSHNETIDFFFKLRFYFFRLFCAFRKNFFFFYFFTPITKIALQSLVYQNRSFFSREMKLNCDYNQKEKNYATIKWPQKYVDVQRSHKRSHVSTRARQLNKKKCFLTHCSEFSVRFFSVVTYVTYNSTIW